MATAVAQVTGYDPTQPAQRDRWGALIEVPDWVPQLLEDVERMGAWETGVAGDGYRGTAINTSVYSVDPALGLALVQVRECRFDLRKDYRSVRKDYFLIGRNETGTPFAHPVDVRAAGRVVGDDVGFGVRLALSRVWDCDLADIDRVVRNGDVGFVPVDDLPPDAEAVDGEVTLAESHVVRALRGGQLYRAPESNEFPDEYYVRGPASIRHRKRQHPAARVNAGTWRVQVGRRARTWGFSRPTAD
jgi:hypothetical protein